MRHLLIVAFVLLATSASAQPHTDDNRIVYEKQFNADKQLLQQQQSTMNQLVQKYINNAYPKSIHEDVIMSQIKALQVQIDNTLARLNATDGWLCGFIDYGKRKKKAL